MTANSFRFLGFFAAGMAVAKVVDLAVGSPQYLDSAIFAAIVAAAAFWLAKRREKRPERRPERS